MSTVKSFEITKKLVVEAYKRVKANGGAAGVDGQTIAMFEEDLNVTSRNKQRLSLGFVSRYLSASPACF